MKRKQNGNITTLVIVAVIAAVVSGVTAGLLAYNKGKDDKQSETREAVEMLATAISQKQEIQEKTAETFPRGAEGFTADNIGEYAEKLEKLSAEVKNEVAKEKYKNLVEEVRKFREVYSEGDNTQIQEEFERIKAEVVAAESAIENELNEKIKQAVENLNLYASR